jgi:uncharacterized protein
MYMIGFSKITGFQWDKGNIIKNPAKHQIKNSQSEEIFLDEDLLIIEDIKHSQKENRQIAIGKSFDKTLLFIVFTIRKQKIRIISARKANKKEKKAYEQLKKNSQI